MLLQLALCVFIRIGRQRLPPREILSTGTDRRDVRRAETAWRREYADRAPPVGETTAALRALGAVRDGDRVASLLRWCDARGAAYSPSAAVAALALAGHKGAARARAAASNVDAVAAALTADGVSPHLAALHAAQRTGALDLHGLDPAEATRAVALLLDHRDLLTDDVLVITGRGKHSQKGSVVKSEVHALLERRGDQPDDPLAPTLSGRSRGVRWCQPKDPTRAGSVPGSRRLKRGPYCISSHVALLVVLLLETRNGLVGEIVPAVTPRRVNEFVFGVRLSGCVSVRRGASRLETLLCVSLCFFQATPQATGPGDNLVGCMYRRSPRLGWSAVRRSAFGVNNLWE